ncbi:MAG: GNAT family N-acetyltransferase, partial [Hyphomicrobiaceae bacterium]
MTHQIAACTSSDFSRILEIINLAAEAYRGVIPDECFHDPYMPAAELSREIAAGIDFSGCFDANRLTGVMGIQNVQDVTLIRHAYVDPGAQRSGTGAALLEHLRGQT